MSKKLRVVVAEPAKIDVRAIRDYIARDRPRAAAKWVRDFRRHARSLATFPLRYEVIPEADAVGAPFRHVIFGNYRILYHVTEDEVVILRVIHGGRILTPGMLRSFPPPLPDETAT